MQCMHACVCVCATRIGVTKMGKPLAHIIKLMKVAPEQYLLNNCTFHMFFLFFCFWSILSHLLLLSHHLQNIHPNDEEEIVTANEM